MDFSKATRFPADAATVDNCYSYLDCDVIILDRYIPSRLETADICLAQDELPGGGTVVYFERDYVGTLALRIPSEASAKTSVYINGDEYSFAVAGTGDQPRYALIAGPFEPGCRVKLEITGHVERAVVSPIASDTSDPVSAPEVVAQEPVVTHDVPVDTASELLADIPVQESASVPLADIPVQESASVPLADIPVRESASVPLADIPVRESASDIAEAAPAAVSDSTLVPSPVTSDNGTVLFSDARSRYVLCLKDSAECVCFTVPAKYDIESEGSFRGSSVALNLGNDLFTAYVLRIFNKAHTQYRDFDIVLMQATEDDAVNSCAVHAYTPVTGAFSGEACYIIDRTSSIEESATHSSTSDAVLAIDPVTGYKWGRMDDRNYYFELENGGYEIAAAFTGSGARLIANPGTSNEKVLIRDTSTEAQHYGIRITDGHLVLSLCEGDPAIDYSTLVIRALDTIAVDSGYDLLFGAEPTEKASNTQTSNSISKSQTKAAPLRPEVRSYINRNLASKKNTEAVKTLGVAAGALAIAGGLIALLGKDKN